MFDSVEYAKYSTEFGLPTLQTTCSQAPRVGIRDLPLDKELLDSLSTEAELLHALGQPEDAELEEATVSLAKSGKTVGGSPRRRALSKGPKQKLSRSVRRRIQTTPPPFLPSLSSHMYLTHVHGPFFLFRGSVITLDAEGNRVEDDQSGKQSKEPRREVSNDEADKTFEEPEVCAM